MVYLADDYSKSQMIGIGVTFIIIPIVAIALRLWAKFIARRGVFLDDYLIIVAATFAIGCNVLQLIAATAGQLGQHETDDANGQPILDDPKFVIYEKCKFAVNMITTVGLGFTKASILVWYMSIFRGKFFRFTAQAMMAIVITWAVSFFFSNLFTCYPITPFVEPFYGHTCLNAIAMWYAMSISDFIVDIMILTLPIPMVLGLQLGNKQKVGVLAMFALGATVCAFSVTRMIAYYHVGEGFAAHYADETYYTSPVFFWANIELSSAILCASLPTYRPIWLKLNNQPMSSSMSKPSIHMNTFSKKSKSKDSSWDRSQRLGSQSESLEGFKNITNTTTVDTRVKGGYDDEVALAPKNGIAVEQRVDFSYH